MPSPCTKERIARSCGKEHIDAAVTQRKDPEEASSFHTKTSLMRKGL